MASGRDDIETTVGVLTSGGTRRPSLGECRDTARIVRKAPLEREALDVLLERPGNNPRGAGRCGCAGGIRCCSRCGRSRCWARRLCWR